MNSDYEKLITDCWHRDPSVRPTFLEVMTRLSAMIEEGGGGGGGTSSSSSRASSAGYLNRTYASPLLLSFLGRGPAGAVI